MKIEFSELAFFELKDSFDYYESEQKGLGKRFSIYIKKQVFLLSNNPLAFPKVSQKIRKFTLQKFPFKIYYAVDKDKLLILSIRHQSQKPIKFKHRNNPFN